MNIDQAARKARARGTCRGGSDSGDCAGSRCAAEAGYFLRDWLASCSETTWGCLKVSNLNCLWPDMPGEVGRSSLHILAWPTSIKAYHLWPPLLTGPVARTGSEARSGCPESLSKNSAPNFRVKGINGMEVFLIGKIWQDSTTIRYWEPQITPVKPLSLWSWHVRNVFGARAHGTASSFQVSRTTSPPLAATPEETKSLGAHHEPSNMAHQARQYDSLLVFELAIGPAAMMARHFPHMALDVVWSSQLQHP